MTNRSVCVTVGDCGSYGLECVSGQCICQDTWSTNMDWVNFEFCGTNSIAIYILWSLNVLEIIYVFYKSSWVILARIENFFEQRKQKRNYTLWQNKGLIAVLFSFGISQPIQLAMAILHLVDPFTRIGFDLLPSLLFFFAKVGFYCAVIFSQGPMLAVTLRGDPNKQQLVRLGYIANSFSGGVSICAGALAFLTLTQFQSVDDQTQQVQVMQSYYFCQGLIFVFNLALSLLIMRKVREAFERANNLVSDEQNKNSSIRKKVNDLQMSSARQALVQGAIYILMGSIPFFWTYHAYFLPMSWLAMPLLGMKLAHQVNLDKNGAKALMQRFGLLKTSTVGGPADDKSTNKENASSLIQGTMNNHQVIVMNSTVPPMPRRANVSSAVGSETTQMEELLSPQNPAHDAFIKFVKDRFASSELELLEQCIMYKKAISSKERKKIGNGIIKKFIIDGAPNQVDIPDGTKKILLSTAAKNMYVEQTFDSIRGPLVFEIKGNFFSSFEKKMSVNEVDCSGNFTSENPVYE